MFRNVYLVLTLASFFLLASCASDAYYSAAVQSWRGAPVEQLIHSWGPPTKQWSDQPGVTYYSYNYHHKGTNPVYTSAGATLVDQNASGGLSVTTVPTVVSGGGSYFEACNTWFEVDTHEHRILGGNFNGNNCAMTQQEALSKSNPENLPVFGGVSP